MLFAPKCGKFDTSRGKNISEKVNYSCFTQDFFAYLLCILGLDSFIRKKWLLNSISREKNFYASDFHILCTFLNFLARCVLFIYKTTTKMICNAFFTVPLFKSLISQLRWSFRLITGPPFVVTIKCNRGSITLWAIFKWKKCLKKEPILK